MGLFGRSSSKKAKDTSSTSNEAWGADFEEMLQKSIQMDLGFNNSIVKCKKCGNKFTMNEGWQLFHSMAKEEVNMNVVYDSMLICSKCFSIFRFQHDYKKNRIVLTVDETHDKALFLQEKYL